MRTENHTRAPTRPPTPCRPRYVASGFGHPCDGGVLAAGRSNSIHRRECIATSETERQTISPMTSSCLGGTGPRSATAQQSVFPWANHSRHSRPIAESARGISSSLGAIRELASRRPAHHPPGRSLVIEADAEAIRGAFEADGELTAAVELRTD
jgi:hypothetical protein